MSDEVKANLSDLGVPGAENIGDVTFFTNTFGTITNGVDIVATYPMALAGGNTLWTFAGNFNETEVVDRTDETVINDYRVIQLEQTLPTMRFTLTGDHRQGAWRFLGRVYWYNSFTEYTAGNGPDNRVDAGQQWQVDFETSYTMKNRADGLSRCAKTCSIRIRTGPPGFQARGIPSIRPLDSTADSIT